MSGKPNEFWSDERVERLKVLVRSGMSYRDIGYELGCTRNGAIGKATRLGIRAEHPKPARERKPRVNKREPGGTVPPERVITPNLIRQAVSTRVVTEMPSHRIRIYSSEGGNFVGGARSLGHHEVKAVTWTEEVTDTMACWECFQPSSMCHWPVRGEPFQFCGAPQVGYTGVPYCERHARRAVANQENLKRSD